jgi:hypothetical protein
MVIPLELVLYNAAGFSEILPFTLTIGQSNKMIPWVKMPMDTIFSIGVIPPIHSARIIAGSE